jgi:type II secretory pathway pseudopilin PulG
MSVRPAWKLRRLSADRSGDTIIEVLVVLAVLGLAIGLAYATANRSLLNARQAQEHSEAAGLVEKQVENLRLLVSNSTAGNTDPTTNIFLTTTPFCVRDPNAAPPIDTTASDCNMSSAGSAVGYKVFIYNCDNQPAVDPCATAIPNSGTFAVQATWDDILGQGTDSVTMTYRLHDPNPAAVAEDDEDPGDGSLLNPDLAVTGCTGPIVIGLSANCLSGDTIAVTVSGVIAGDTCILRNDSGSGSGTALKTVTADATGCSANLKINSITSGQTGYLTAYVTDNGNPYKSNSLTLNSWSKTPIHTSCSWPGSDHAYGGVNYSNWVYTIGSDGCSAGTTQCIKGVNCVSGSPSDYGANVACWTGSGYVYGTTWNGHDHTAIPCPPGTSRISLAPAAPPGLRGSPGPEMVPPGYSEGAWA